MYYKVLPNLTLIKINPIECIFYPFANSIIFNYMNLMNQANINYNKNFLNNSYCLWISIQGFPIIKFNDKQSEALWFLKNS